MECKQLISATKTLCLQVFYPIKYPICQRELFNASFKAYAAEKVCMGVANHSNLNFQAVIWVKNVSETMYYSLCCYRIAVFFIINRTTNRTTNYPRET